MVDHTQLQRVDETMKDNSPDCSGEMIIEQLHLDTVNRSTNKSSKPSSKRICEVDHGVGDGNLSVAEVVMANKRRLKQCRSGESIEAIYEPIEKKPLSPDEETEASSKLILRMESLTLCEKIQEVCASQCYSGKSTPAESAIDASPCSCSNMETLVNDKVPSISSHTSNSTQEMQNYASYIGSRVSVRTTITELARRDSRLRTMIEDMLKPELCRMKFLTEASCSALKDRGIETLDQLVSTYLENGSRGRSVLVEDFKIEELYATKLADEIDRWQIEVRRCI